MLRGEHFIACNPHKCIEMAQLCNTKFPVEIKEEAAADRARNNQGAERVGF
jgi:hypothetical protein